MLVADGAVTRLVTVPCEGADGVSVCTTVVSSIWLSAAGRNRVCVEACATAVSMYVVGARILRTQAYCLHGFHFFLNLKELFIIQAEYKGANIKIPVSSIKGIKPVILIAVDPPFEIVLYTLKGSHNGSAG